MNRSEPPYKMRSRLLRARGRATGCRVMELTTIIFLALAVFVIWKLRSVLGQRTGHESRPMDMGLRGDTGAPAPANDSNVVRLDRPVDVASAPQADPADPDRWKGIAEAGTPLAG